MLPNLKNNDDLNVYSKERIIRNDKNVVFKEITVWDIPEKCCASNDLKCNLATFSPTEIKTLGFHRH